MPKRKSRDAEKIEESKSSTGPAKQTSQSHEDQEPTPSGIEHFSIPFNDKTIPCILHGPNNNANPEAPFIFTHGAGGGIKSPAMTDFAAGFATITPIVSFQGNLNLTSRIKMFNTVIEHQKSGKVFGGRSMGARAAVLTALERKDVEALVLVSYPLMAGSKGEKREYERREKILLDLAEGVDVLFVVGSEDVMCPGEMLEGLRGEMKARTWVCVVEGADHGMEVKGGEEMTRGMRERAGEVVAEWVQKRNGEQRRCETVWDEERRAIGCEGWR